MTETTTPIAIRAFVERTYPHFFSVPRRPLEVAAHLCLILEADRSGLKFKTTVEHIGGEVRVTLIGSGDLRCTFVVTDRDLHTALFRATEAAMNDPRCSAFFDR
jgi:hypothetical protein